MDVLCLLQRFGICGNSQNLVIKRRARRGGHKPIGSNNGDRSSPERRAIRLLEVANGFIFLFRDSDCHKDIATRYAARHPFGPSRSPAGR